MRIAIISLLAAVAAGDECSLLKSCGTCTGSTSLACGWCDGTASDPGGPVSSCVSLNSSSWTCDGTFKSTSAQCACAGTNVPAELAHTWRGFFIDGTTKGEVDVAFSNAGANSTGRVIMKSSAGTKAGSMLDWGPNTRAHFCALPHGAAARMLWAQMSRRIRAVPRTLCRLPLTMATSLVARTASTGRRAATRFPFPSDATRTPQPQTILMCACSPARAPVQLSLITRRTPATSFPARHSVIAANRPHRHSTRTAKCCMQEGNHSLQLYTCTDASHCDFVPPVSLKDSYVADAEEIEAATVRVASPRHRTQSPPSASLSQPSSPTLLTLDIDALPALHQPSTPPRAARHLSTLPTLPTLDTDAPDKPELGTPQATTCEALASCAECSKAAGCEWCLGKLSKAGVPLKGQGNVEGRGDW